MAVASDCTEVRQVEKKMKETIAKINKTKSWFFEKINKIDKPLAGLKNKQTNKQKPKGEDSNQQKTNGIKLNSKAFAQQRKL